MIREVSLEEISDGRLYEANDMVKADCGDCKGCFSCCCGMGTSVVLDPLDVDRLTKKTGLSFLQLLEKNLELNVAEGIILPNLKMTGERDCCSFLNQDGRCTIHDARPGICRMFPLGRYYEGDSFKYFLQVHECRNQHRTKIKVKKWLDTPELARYEAFIKAWHSFLKQQSELLASARFSEEAAKKISMQILNQFYIQPFRADEDFYTQFYARLKQMQEG